MPLLVPVLLLFASASVSAAEVDSITTKRVELRDAAVDINIIVNERIQQGVERANAGKLLEFVGGVEVVNAKPQCDVDGLYDSLRLSIFQSYTLWGLKGYDLDLQFRQQLAEKIYSLRLRDSIYRDIDYLEGFSLNLKELTAVANINGLLVGLDKVGHFFAEGWRYFQISRESDGDLRRAMAWGVEKEEGLFGYTTTGIFSYADLVANFHGWRFWNRVLLEDPDPLTGPVARLFDRPYVSCDVQWLESIKQLRPVRAWSVNKRFDLRDYIDAAWNEAINCNSYADPVIEDKVRARIAEHDKDYVCPIDALACIAAREHYGGYARELLHPACLTTE